RPFLVHGSHARGTRPLAGRRVATRVLVPDTRGWLVISTAQRKASFMKTLQELLDLRFGDIGAVPEILAANQAIRRLPGRGVGRRFKPEPLPVGVLDTLDAVALSSPSKSDLQQRDILIVEDAAIRARINALLKDQDWIPGCPHLLVFLGNNRR